MDISSRHLIAIFIGLCVTALYAYNFGFNFAKAQGDMAIAKLESKHTNDIAGRALIVAEVEKHNREALEKAYANASRAEKKFHDIEKKYADSRRENAKLSRQVAQDALAHCSGLPADWVRQHNAYTSGGFARYPHSDEGSSTAYSSPSAGASSATPPSVSWLQQGQPLVTPADLLAFTRDAAAVCHRNENQLNQLIDILGSQYAEQ